MAFDFPASPTNGQIFAPAGGPTYVWNGTAWDTQVGSVPWDSVTGKPATFPPDAHSHTQLVNGAGLAALDASGNLTSSGHMFTNQNFTANGGNVVLATTGAATVYLRPNGAASGTGELRVDNTGNAYCTQITSANGVQANGHAFGGNGAVYLRPNGIASDTGRCTVDSTGAFTAPASLNTSGNVNGLHFSGYHYYVVDGYTINAGSGASVYLFANLRNKNTLSGGYGSNWFTILWNSANYIVFVDNTNLGAMMTTSDYRIKKDVEPLTSTWDQVKALKPVAYTQTDFHPVQSKEAKAREIKAAIDAYAASNKVDAKSVDPDVAMEARQEKPAEGPLFKANDDLQWGFIAHEVQETLLMSTASGHKDCEDAVQSLNWAPIVAALTKALQEAMTRIEALEARP